MSNTDSSDGLADFLNQAPIANDSASNITKMVGADIILSAAQEQIVIQKWNSGATNLKDIVQAVFPGKDGRSDEGKAVKKFLASRQLKATPAQTYSKKTDKMSLTDDQKDFIKSSASTGTKILQIARDLFSNNTLAPLSSEFLVVKEYYDSLDPSFKTNSDPNDSPADYNPPKNEIQAIARINKYVLDGIDKDKITPKQREAVVKMIKFMHTYRFLHEMKLFQKVSERELFESSFVRFVWDKPDLTEEEIDLYINLCSDIIAAQRMQLELNFLTEQRDITMSIDNKLPMAIVEAIGKLRSDIDANGKKQSKTLQDLNGKRADRLDKIRADNASVLTLVEAFRDAEKRKRFIANLESRKQQVVQEADRLESLDELLFEIFGASKKELIN